LSHAFRQLRLYILRIIIALLIVIAMALVSGYVYTECCLPNMSILNETQSKLAVHIDQIPKPLIQAILATEDTHFYSHHGVDFMALLRAARAVIHSGHKVQGASTITMQVARNFFLTPQKTYTRKIKEILLAIKIDSTLSKQQILELYLNKVYFGKGAYGVVAAAHVYYRKSLNQLTLPEMAMIAGLPQSPSRNNPFANPARALKRRNHVLKRMLNAGYINQKAYEDAITS